MKPLRKGDPPAFAQQDLPFDELETMSRQWVGKDVVYGRVVARVIGFRWHQDHISQHFKNAPRLMVVLLPLRWHLINSIVTRPWKRDPVTGISGPIKGPWRIRQIRPEAKVFTVHSCYLESSRLIPQR